MNQLTRPSLVFGSLSFISLSTLVLTVAALALPSQEVSTTYYSDSNQSEVVGEVTLLCNGQRTQWGKKTRFASQSTEPCHGGSPPKPPSPNPPCEFLQTGCSPIPNRQDGHFLQQP